MNSKSQQVRNLDFADDVILLVEFEEDLQLALDTIQSFYIKRKLTPNPKKCELIVFDPKKRNLKKKPTFVGKELKEVKDFVYLGACFSVDGKWTKHIKKRTRRAACWRWKASSVARRHGKAPLGAERHIRDAGEKASGLYGAETWVAMTGSRYEELNTKQGRMEREMLGMTKKQELWRAREEMGTRSWASEKFLQKLGIIQTM